MYVAGESSNKLKRGAAGHMRTRGKNQLQEKQNIGTGIATKLLLNLKTQVDKTLSEQT